MEKIKNYIEEKQVSDLKQFLLDTDYNEILDEMSKLDLHEQAIVFRLLPKDKSFDVFEQMEVTDQEELLGALSGEHALQLVEELDTDDRVRLFDELPSEVTKKLLAKLSPEERAKTNLLMGYEEETAGRIMTPDFVRLRGSLTAAQALAKVKRKGFETIYTVYVTDDKGKLEGVLSLRDLLLAKPETIISTIMETEIVKVSTNTDQEQVARLLQKRDLLAIPVVDSHDYIVGIITVDDAMDILEEETTEDILKSAGINTNESNLSEVLVSGSLWSKWKIRLPFLLFTLVGGLIAGMVMESFEDVLYATLAAAFFIPVVLDMGGSTGVQSATIFTRAYVLGHIDKSRFRKQLFHETFAGFTMGVFTGVLSGLAIWAWQGYALGLAVGSALVIVMTLAAFIGFFIPYILIKLKIDQAAASGAIITTVKDISGLLIYFTLVAVFLGVV